MQRWDERPAKFRPWIPPGNPDAGLCPAGPLDIEIGCGVGWHALTYAGDHPERTLVAIEKTWAKFDKFRRRVERHGHPANLVPVHAHAVSWIAQNIEKETVDRCFILYPNPAPGRRRLNQRWYAMAFTPALIQILKPGGTLHLATNLPDYAGGARHHLSSGRGLRLLHDRQLRGDTDVPRTHFEKKYLDRGETCFDLVFIREGPGFPPKAAPDKL